MLDLEGLYPLPAILARKAAWKTFQRAVRRVKAEYWRRVVD